jgi:hypothetical protein
LAVRGSEAPMLSLKTRRTKPLQSSPWSSSLPPRR